MRRFSALAGGAALAVLMVPTLARSTEELVRLVPDSLREASLALGVPQWRTSLRVVLRTALGGIMTAILLSVARASGETAPLLFTSLNNQYWNWRADQPTASLTVQIQTAQANLDAASAKLALDKAGPTAATIASALDSVKQAKLQLATARQRLERPHLDAGSQHR